MSRLRRPPAHLKQAQPDSIAFELLLLIKSSIHTQLLGPLPTWPSSTSCPTPASIAELEYAYDEVRLFIHKIQPNESSIHGLLRRSNAPSFPSSTLASQLFLRSRPSYRWQQRCWINSTPPIRHPLDPLSLRGSVDNVRRNVDTLTKFSKQGSNHQPISINPDQNRDLYHPSIPLRIKWQYLMPSLDVERGWNGTANSMKPFPGLPFSHSSRDRKHCHGMLVAFNA